MIQIGLRFLMWSGVCWASAGPSFVIAANMYGGREVLAMAIGVFGFVIAYTIVTSLPWWKRLMRKRAVWIAVWVGFGTRIALSIAPLVFFPAIVVDLWCGVFSTGVVSMIMGGEQEAETFVGILLTTIVQGVVLNVALLGFMTFVWGVAALIVGREPTRGMCVECGYDLRGNVTGVCPECGGRIAAGRVRG